MLSPLVRQPSVFQSPSLWQLLGGALSGFIHQAPAAGITRSRGHAEVMGSDRARTSFTPRCSSRALCLRASSSLTKSFSRDADRTSVDHRGQLMGGRAAADRGFCFVLFFNLFEVWEKFDFIFAALWTETHSSSSTWAVFKTKVQSETQVPTNQPLVCWVFFNLTS